jgi:hypothetical protein
VVISTSASKGLDGSAEASGSNGVLEEILVALLLLGANVVV